MVVIVIWLTIIVEPGLNTLGKVLSAVDGRVLYVYQ